MANGMFNNYTTPFIEIISIRRIQVSKLSDIFFALFLLQFRKPAAVLRSKTS
ncbi:hypothetical protein ACVWYG_002407 [Pedobacter sp. UYEF25]